MAFQELLQILRGVRIRIYKQVGQLGAQSPAGGRATACWGLASSTALGLASSSPRSLTAAPTYLVAARVTLDVSTHRAGSLVEAPACAPPGLGAALSDDEHLARQQLEADKVGDRDQGARRQAADGRCHAVQRCSLLAAGSAPKHRTRRVIVIHLQCRAPHHTRCTLKPLPLQQRVAAQAAADEAAAAAAECERVRELAAAYDALLPEGVQERVAAAVERELVGGAGHRGGAHAVVVLLSTQRTLQPNVEVYLQLVSPPTRHKTTPGRPACLLPGLGGHERQEALG